MEEMCNLQVHYLSSPEKVKTGWSQCTYIRILVQEKFETTVPDTRELLGEAVVGNCSMYQCFSRAFHLFPFPEDCFMQSVLCLSSMFTLKFEVDGHPMISPEQVFFAMNLLYKLLWSLSLTSVVTLAFNVFAQISCPKNLPLNMSSRRKWCSCNHRCWLIVLHTRIPNWRNKGSKPNCFAASPAFWGWCLCGTSAAAWE